jgi:hypothetical protein
MSHKLSPAFFLARRGKRKLVSRQGRRASEETSIPLLVEALMTVSTRHSRLPDVPSGTFTAPRVFALMEILPSPLVRVLPRPRPNLPLGLPHSGGVFVCEASPPKSFRRNNGGDWTEGLTRNVWNIRLYAGITLRWLYFCKRKGR